MRRKTTEVARIAGSTSPLVAALTCIATALLCVRLSGFSFRPQDPAVPEQGQSLEEANRKSEGCVTCHSPMDEPTMHPTKTVQLGCTDCHGGSSSARVMPGTARNSPEYLAA